MTAEQWAKVKDVVAAALDLPDAERRSFVERACGNDSVAVDEALSLLNVEITDPVQLDALPTAGAPTFSGAAAGSGFTPGTMLAGRYRIVALVGRGGMGEVYRADDLKLDQAVALKFLPRTFASDPKLRELFFKEVRITRQLSHPNICRVYDIAECEDQHFLSMEYIDGENLASLIKRVGYLSNEKALQITRQLLAGLAAAHEHGVLHRDLKPANIMLDGRGRVRIMDFGIAVAAGDETRLGEVCGTPAYMAPEQFAGMPASERSDIYSVGLVLYEIYCGKRALKEKDEPVPLPSNVREGVDSKVERLIMRCLESDPQLRPVSVAELAAGLDDDHPARQAGFRSDKRKMARLFIGAAATIAIAAIVAVLLFRPSRAAALTERDTILLADFGNTTGEPLFDGTLKEVLAVKLDESPYLHVVPDDRIQQTLRLMGRSPEEHITPAVGREICERQGAKAMMTGSISSLGTQYVVTLTVVNCQTGASIARVQAEAANKDAVLRALGTAITSLRGRLGESLASIQRFDGPVEEVTTSSLEALKAWTRARVLRKTGKRREAVPLLEHAIEIDPNFVQAYVTLANVYTDLREPALRIQTITHAYEHRNRVTELERLDITARYHLVVTGDLQKAFDALTLLQQTYPTDPAAYNMLATGYYGPLGQIDRVAEAFREAARLQPDSPVFPVNLATAYIALNRLDEAKTVLQQVAARSPNNPPMHSRRFLIAELEHDAAAAQVELDWLTKHDPENAFALQAAEAGFSGKIRTARAFYTKSVNIAIGAGLAENAAQTLLNLAEGEAVYGLADGARRDVTAALKLASGRDEACAASRILALAGFSKEAKPLFDQCLKEYPPTHTLAKTVFIPAIRAALDLRAGNAATAVDELQQAAPYEGQSPGVMYLRASAYLSANRPADAATEFQKVLDHTHNSLNSYLPIAELGRARALGRMGDFAGSRTAYQDFFAGWKDADADLPILLQAKQEYAKLPSR